MKKQDNNNNALPSHHNNDSNQKKIVIGSSQEIADMMMEETEKKERKKLLIELGSHNLLIYNDLKTLREIISQYSKALLPKNEIVVIAIQYDALREVKITIRLAGVDVGSQLNQGTLYIIDAQQGYQGIDPKSIWKLGMSLLTCAKKEVDVELRCSVARAHFSVLRKLRS